MVAARRHKKDTSQKLFGQLLLFIGQENLASVSIIPFSDNYCIVLYFQQTRFISVHVVIVQQIRKFFWSQ